VHQPSNHQQPASTVSSSSASYSAGQNVIDVHRQNSWLSWLVGISYLPITIVKVGISFTYHVATDLFYFIARLIWPSLGRVATDPLDDVLKFKREYEETFGSVHPTFYLGSYSQVLSDAKKELKFLLVYLHHTDHRDTQKFCREVFNHPGFTEYINGNMLCWSCDVQTNEGYKVSRAMRENGYPFLAIACLRDNQMTVVWRIQGMMGVDELIANIARVIDENETTLIAARAERNERSLNQVLRNEQDAAYLESLAEDAKKEKEKEKIIEQSKIEEQLRIDKENEKIRKIKELEDKRRKAREYFESSVEPSSTDVGSIQIRIKLPTGKLLQRYFLKTDLLNTLYNFVISYDESPAEFLLSTSFPKQTFPLLNNENKTLEDVKITVNTAMFVQNTADESSSEEEG